MQTTITKRRVMFSVILCAMLVSMPRTAFAHDGPPRLELSTDRVNPGAVIEVRGINLAPEAVIAIVLVRNESETQLGQATSDAEGDFSQVLTLPVDLTEGDYSVRAVSQGQVSVSALLRIVGAATGEDGEQRGEDEPLLAPMPTQAAGTGHSSAAPSANTATSFPTTSTETPIPTTVLFLSALAIAVLVAGLVIILRRFR